MAKRKNWKYTRNGVEYTLSVGGLMKFCRGGWCHSIIDDISESEWRGEPWEETVLIWAFRGTGLGHTYKQGCSVIYLDGNGKIRETNIMAPGGWGGSRFKHLDE